MFSRTPKSKNRAHGSNQKRHRPYGTPYAHTHTEKEGDAISMGSQMAIRTPAAAVAGSPRTIKTTRKLNVLNEEYQSAHLFNVGDLLIVRESEITLHQDISTGFNRGIATPFPVPTGAGANTFVTGGTYDVNTSLVTLTRNDDVTIVAFKI